MPSFRKLMARYRDAYNAEAYDAITMALLAIQNAGSEDRSAVRDALSKVSFDSVRGPFNFDEKGDPLLLTHVIKIVNGKETNGRDIPVQDEAHRHPLKDSRARDFTCVRRPQEQEDYCGYQGNQIGDSTAAGKLFRSVPSRRFHLCRRPTRERLEGRVPKEARKHPNFPFYGSDIKLQADFILKNLAKRPSKRPALPSITSSRPKSS